MTEPKRATIYDVARTAGVSKSLVSLVLRNSPNVSPARRQAVLEAIEQLNYRPSHAAASLAGGSSRTVGVVIDDYTNLWFVELLRGLQDGLSAAGLRIAVSDRTLNAHIASDPLDGFLSTRVEALVLATEPTESMRIPANMPVVVAGNRAMKIPGADVVASDDRAGARQATEHLLSLGHRRIGHLTGGGGASQQRREGYEQAMRAAGLEALVIAPGSATTEETGYRGTQELLTRFPNTTAILAGNDSMAMGALAAARERDLQVPGELSVVGYDASPLAATHLLQLTTVDSLNSEIGAEVAAALLSRLADPAREPVSVRLAPRLIQRRTTAAPGRR
ncbi:LacI family DNA-binding transcriptional regulator [Zhihengliuella flava]|uniref:DNA-binding LacI/PurR family transcriptional regulator n=1 Tax=Zhihengliuella flava TaxID=1285193 RepID=A0A931D8G7_9MICC|nr:LacI family DNA-binding transcriptional regulator [Zhihengliuella flava]MBG6084324.1 DNA-binding LacI/PurR family transcriptional regulator [Zhihengliuella flava]